MNQINKNPYYSNCFLKSKNGAWSVSHEGWGPGNWGPPWRRLQPYGYPETYEKFAWRSAKWSVPPQNENAGAQARYPKKIDFYGCSRPGSPCMHWPPLRARSCIALQTSGGRASRATSTAQRYIKPALIFPLSKGRWISEGVGWFIQALKGKARHFTRSGGLWSLHGHCGVLSSTVWEQCPPKRLHFYARWCSSPNIKCHKTIFGGL